MSTTDAGGTAEELGGSCAEEMARLAANSERAVWIFMMWVRRVR
jgi:hypothetical protein